jgi:hypothetical protein
MDTVLILMGCAALAAAALVVCAVCLGAVAQTRAPIENRRTHRLRFWLRVQGVLR